MAFPLSYAVSDNTYRAMRTERKDQCILISGESGAGKTEASKKILLYYAVTCPTNDQMASLGDRLLQSNPVLEVIGISNWTASITIKSTGNSDFLVFVTVLYPIKW